MAEDINVHLLPSELPGTGGVCAEPGSLPPLLAAHRAWPVRLCGTASTTSRWDDPSPLGPRVGAGRGLGCPERCPETPSRGGGGSVPGDSCVHLRRRGHPAPKPTLRVSWLPTLTALWLEGGGSAQAWRSRSPVSGPRLPSQVASCPAGQTLPAHVRSTVHPQPLAPSLAAK